MNGLGYGLVGLALGVALGAVVFVTRRRWAAGAPGDITRSKRGSRCSRPSCGASPMPEPAREGDAERLRSELAGARQALEELALRDDERRERDRDYGRSSGACPPCSPAARRRAARARTSCASTWPQLPPGMLVTDFRVGGKVVEFGLLLPDGRRLPVDSKWTALAELEALEAAEDPAEREARAREVERAVAARAREVAQYLDPALTAPVAVAAVPDAAYAVLRRAHADAFGRGRRDRAVLDRAAGAPLPLQPRARYGDAGDVQAALQEVATRSTRWRRRSRTSSRALPRCSRTGPTSCARSSARRGLGRARTLEHQDRPVEGSRPRQRPPGWRPMPVTASGRLGILSLGPSRSLPFDGSMHITAYLPAW